MATVIATMVLLMTQSPARPPVYYTIWILALLVAMRRALKARVVIGRSIIILGG